jgi:hypothetical protein
MARADEVDRDDYDRATDAGELVIAPSLRAAIHALAPDDFATYGRALLSENEHELAEQLGQQMQRVLAATGIRASDALEEVAQATEAALSDGRALTKDELHDELRGRVRGALMPWCQRCGSHHVAPMLWRFAGLRAGMRCDSRRRFLLGDPGAPPAAVAIVRRFLHHYGPATSAGLAAWGGLASGQARRLWEALQEELVEVRVDGRRLWVLAEDRDELDSPPTASGVRLLPARDPYLQQPQRDALVPDADLRKRLFRPTSPPGALLQDGRLAGLWRAAQGRRTRLEVERIDWIDRDALEDEAARVARARGTEAAAVEVS